MKSQRLEGQTKRFSIFFILVTAAHADNLGRLAKIRQLYVGKDVYVHSSALGCANQKATVTAIDQDPKAPKPHPDAFGDTPETPPGSTFLEVAIKCADGTEHKAGYTEDSIGHVLSLASVSESPEASRRRLQVGIDQLVGRTVSPVNGAEVFSTTSTV